MKVYGLKNVEAINFFKVFFSHLSWGMHHDLVIHNRSEIAKDPGDNITVIASGGDSAAVMTNSPMGVFDACVKLPLH